jgi:hypothetical protein
VRTISFGPTKTGLKRFLGSKARQKHGELSPLLGFGEHLTVEKRSPKGCRTKTSYF